MDGGGASADVKLVDGRQLLGGDVLRVDAGSGDGLQNAVRQVADPVVPHHRRFKVVSHRHLPAFQHLSRKDSAEHRWQSSAGRRNDTNRSGRAVDAVPLTSTAA